MFASPADAAAVLLMDLGILLGLFVLARLLVPEKAADRALFGAFTAVLILTYAVWRWHDTLPRFEPTIESLWPYLFFLFEGVAITYTLLSIAILLRRSDRSAEAAFAENQLQAAGFWPAVDIFICTYNEPLDVLEKSILPALAIDYGPKAVWVLDDTRRPWLKDYCDKVGARYVSRPDNKGAKAGNLNNGLAISAAATRAPLILVLDADFAPQPNILKRMVGLFADPAVGVVRLGDAVRGRRVQPPLEHVAVHDHGPRQGPFGVPVLHRPDVHDQRTGRQLPRQLLRLDALQVTTGLRQDLVDA